MTVGRFIRFSTPSVTRTAWEDAAQADNSLDGILSGTETLTELSFFPFSASEDGKKYLGVDTAPLQEQLSALFQGAVTSVGKYANGTASVAIKAAGRRCKAYGIKGLVVLDGVPIKLDKAIFGFCVQNNEPVWAPATDMRRKTPQVYCDISKAL